jgi:DNA-binding NtrC family response regulator
MAKPPVETLALSFDKKREVAFRRLRVQVTKGPDAGIEAVADGAELTIGTDPGNHLVLTDPTVSRHHCVIAASADGFRLRDMGSKNGTRLATYRVEAAHLRPGAILELGASTVRVDALEDDIREPLSEEETWGRMLGRSEAMRRIFAILPRLAAAESTILLEGETGTGKTLLAEAIHQASRRGRGPFVVVDCGAIPPTLIESELFGHVRGAFTDAQASRAGAFESAHGGTVFLDEIGELPLDMQPKLLRAIEDRTVRRLGANEPVRLDVRLIAATNRDLRAEVNRGAFRSDLFYRLNTVRMRIPPLRERREDIPLMVDHFHEQITGSPAPPELIADLQRHSWPGNVRELRSAVERAVLLGDPTLWDEIASVNTTPQPAAAPIEFDASMSFRVAKERAVAMWERAWIGELVRRAGGNLSRAAREARMDRNHLRELVRRHHIAVKDE